MELIDRRPLFYFTFFNNSFLFFFFQFLWAWLWLWARPWLSKAPSAVRRTPSGGLECQPHVTFPQLVRRFRRCSSPFEKRKENDILSPRKKASRYTLLVTSLSLSWYYKKRRDRERISDKKAIQFTLSLNNNNKACLLLCTSRHGSRSFPNAGQARGNIIIIILKTG